MNALFVLAHQDDELAAATRILHLVRAGTIVHCAYLTNGGVSSKARDAESRAALATLGVRNAHFLGSAHGIPDGVLIEHADAALALLERAMNGIALDEIYTLAWEGGHQDHDAAHLIAVAFAARRNLLERTWEFPLYHGHRSRFFRVLSPLANGRAWTRRALALRDGLASALLCRFYTSQRKTWMGLLPEALLKLVVLRRECLRLVDVDHVQGREPRQDVEAAVAVVRVGQGLAQALA